MIVERLSENEMVESACPELYFSIVASEDSLPDPDWAYDYINWSLSDSSPLIGIIDTGIQPGVYFRNSLSSLSYNFVNNSTTDSMVDTHGHGTAVAGIIAADYSNGDDVRLGMLPNANLVSLRINYTKQGDASVLDRIIAAINYARINNIPVLNLSWHIDNPILASAADIEYYFADFKEALQLYPGVLVCSAGNDGYDISDRLTWARLDCPNMLVVGAYDCEETKCSFSNYSDTCVDIFAPGAAVGTVSYDYPYPIQASGTSFAAPFVTSVAALLSLEGYCPSTIVNNIRLHGFFNDDFMGYCIGGKLLNADDAIDCFLVNYHSYEETATHVYTCQTCTAYYTTHNFIIAPDNTLTHSNKCTCGVIDYTENHTPGYWYNATQHIYGCTICGYTVSAENHTFTTGHSTTTHNVSCATCGYAQQTPVTYSYTQHNDTYHYACCPICNTSHDELHSWVQRYYAIAVASAA